MQPVEPANHIERAADCPFALTRPQTTQHRRRPLAAQHHRITGHRSLYRQGVCNRDGLIEPALPQPPPVQWDGDQDTISGQAPCKNRSNRPRKPRTARMLQAQDNALGDIAIGHGGNNSVKIGLLFETRRAGQVIADFERTRTVHATRRCQKTQLGPACCAKTVVVFDNRCATRTARRQHEIEDGTEGTHVQVVDPGDRRHKREMANIANQVPDLFDRDARIIRRRRAKPHSFFAETMSSDLLERLDSVNRQFSKALLIGNQPLLAEALNARGIGFDCHTADEDRLVGRDGAHDLVLSSGTLDTVSDLPGALLLMRRALMPDGLLLANLASAPSLTALRAATAAADAAHQQAVARFHPQIDVRAAGDLLMRAGYALPVADLTTSDVAYSSLTRLLTDLREAAGTNVLVQRYPVSKRWLADVAAAFGARAQADGRTRETLSYVTLTAWAPAPSQPQPARRGSGVTSLSDALRRRSD